MSIDRRQFLSTSSRLLAAAALGGVGACGEAERSAAESAGTDTGIELLGSYWTIAGDTEPREGREYSLFDFKDRVEALSRAGFKGMGIWHADLDHIRRTYSLAEMERILGDNGIEHLELEFLVDWFLDGERKRQSDRRRAELLEAAAALGARHVKVGDFFNEEVEMPRLIDSFAGLCSDGADVGTRIVFELMPFSMIDSLQGTLTMLEGAGADNGGVILDTWHCVKLGITNDEIARIPKRFLLGVELNDGYLETPDGMTLHEETIGHRKLCGEGEFDVPAFITAVQAAGYDGPWGVEVISEDLRKLPLEEIVTRSYATTIAQFRA